MLAYGAASLAHHIHNAEFLAGYPNMPAWLTPAQVYLAWTVETAVGLVGYVLLRAGYRLPGLFLIAAYAVAGFGGLDHYFVAPFAAHTPGMHLTILFEVATAALLLAAVLHSIRFERQRT